MAQILKQVRDHQFDEEITKRLAIAENERNQAMLLAETQAKQKLQEELSKQKEEIHRLQQQHQTLLSTEVTKKDEKTKVPPKRPGLAKRVPSVMSQVREIEKKIVAEKKAKNTLPKVLISKKIVAENTRPKVFINKNGDLKIGGRKCRLYKKDELVKIFKLDPKLTKDQMCKFIKNM